MNTNPNPNKKNYIQIITKVKKLGFKQRRIDSMKHQIAFLDREAMSLVSDSEAYYANRNKCWAITEKLLKEVR